MKRFLIPLLLGFSCGFAQAQNLVPFEQEEVLDIEGMIGKPVGIVMYCDALEDAKTFARYQAAENGAGMAHFSMPGVSSCHMLHKLHTIPGEIEAFEAAVREKNFTNFIFRVAVGESRKIYSFIPVENSLKRGEGI